MRERISVCPPVVSSFKVLGRDNQTMNYTDYGLVYYQNRDFSRKIIDEPKTAYVDYAKGVRRRVFKTVSHDQWTALDLSSPRWCTSSADGRWSVYTSGAHILEYHWLAPYSSHPTTPHSDWAYTRALQQALPVDYGHYNRWDQLRPTMATRANLAVFLYELRDFKRLWDFIPAKHLVVNGVKARDWSTIRNWYRKLEGVSTTDLIKYINSQHLNYAFGWKPFISDIKKCWKGLDTFETRLLRFQRDQGRELRKRFRDSPRQVSLTVQSGWFPTWTQWRAEEKYEFKEQHASVFDFSYSIPQYSEEELHWRALLDTLGLKVTPSNIWAILPWSFVMDWFVNVGGFLQAYENDWLQPWVSLHQGCFSRKLEGSYTMSARHLDAYGGELLPDTTVSFSQYIRKVGLPNFSAETDPLDADKIRLGSSLLLSLFLR